MSQRPPPPTGDPTRDFLGEWNPRGADEPLPLDDEDASPFLFPAPSREAEGVSAGAIRRHPFGATRSTAGVPFDDADAPHEGFTLGSELAGPRDDDSLLGVLPFPFPGAGARPESGGPAEASPWPSKPGDEVGGFRVVAELGRGAFARVFLAEQTELGNRLVALKVSRAEGEEPQLLARLQHAHIVPIHSVHDDPETGLRLICMPYLGGANLAQVMEEVGARAASGNGGRSLMAALDEVSQRYQSRLGFVTAASRGGPASRSDPGGPARPAAGAGDGGAGWSARPAADSLFPASFGRGSLERLQNLWDRFTRRRSGAGADPRTSLDDRDFDQPARQFLRGANTVQAAVWVVARLAEGLEHAHGRGILHRDLKPSNVLIAGDGTPMLLDFNLSSPARFSDPAEGEKAMLGGTLPYMAPEHLDAFNPDGRTPSDAVDERSDIYALGLILFEMLAGEHPFPEPPNRSLRDTIRILTDLRRDPPSLRSRNGLVPWSLDAIARHCLEFEPSRRYARARDLAEDLNRFLDDLPLKHTREPSLRERLAKWTRRNPRLCGHSSIAGLSALLIIAFGGVIGFFHGNMQNLSARLKFQVFRDDWARCQLLLNVTSGPPEHLAMGIDLAVKALELERLDPSGAWRSDSWPVRLTAAEQREVREKTAELILRMAEARVHLAYRGPNRAERLQVLAWAVHWLERAERLDPNPPAALYGERARYLTALGRHQRARRDRAREAEIPPTTARDFALLGTTLLARGDVARAEPALRRAVAIDPRSFWAWFALGHCHLEQDRPLEAAGDFAACLVLEPRFAWPSLNRGVALARAGRLVEARDAYEAALRANPRFAEAWLNRALVDLELNDLAAAEAALTRALKLFKGDRRTTGMLAALAELKARRGDPEGAEALFAELLRAHPDDPVVLDARGIFRVRSDPEGAAADFRRALAADPRNARARYGLALLLRKDDPLAALNEVDAALRDQPGFLDALQLRALLRARLGDLAAADDVERLCRVPTAHRLYNAACALALLVDRTGEGRFTGRAVDLLDRALDAGFPVEGVADDPDLAALRGLPTFRAVLKKPRAGRPAPVSGASG